MKKSSKIANRNRKIKQVINGLNQAKPNSPVFVIGEKRKLIKFTRSAYEQLVEKAESLSYWAGYTVSPEQLLRKNRKV